MCDGGSWWKLGIQRLCPHGFLLGLRGLFFPLVKFRGGPVHRLLLQVRLWLVDMHQPQHSHSFSVRGRYIRH